MLILSRKMGERIVIEHNGGERTIIEVQKATPSTIKLGIVAPEYIEIHRAERKQGFSKFMITLLQRLWGN